MTEPRKLRVFLCHASQDKPVVRELYQRLLGEGWIDPWLDEEKLLPGQDWGLEIEKAVETSDLVLVCISHQAVSKEGYLQRELRLVLDVTMNMPEGAIFLIPLKLEECEIPRRLRTWQWVEYFPPENHLAAYKKLSVSLRLRAEKIGISTIGSTPETVDPPRVRSASVRESCLPKVGHAPVTSLAPELDLYIPPEYSGMPFTPPSATVPTWIFGGMEFVKVPHGEFLMGSSDNDKDAYPDEKPQHKLDIPYDFLMARFLVTNILFQEFVAGSAYKTKAEQDGFGYAWNGKEWFKTEGANWKQPYGPQTGIQGLEHHPVVQVIWKDAQEFCKWLNLEYGSLIPRGLVFRLPTETEWEKAARGIDGRLYPWGNDFSPRFCNSKESGRHTTTPVGMYLPQGDSPFGCADMAGNVWEWTASLWGRDVSKPDYRYPYVSNDGRENQKADDDILRIIRGGSFSKNDRFLRTALRFRGHGAGGNYGFRVALAPTLS